MLELRQAMVKQARVIVAVKKENQELRVQLAQTQRLVAENEEMLLAMQLSSLEASSSDGNPVDIDHMSYERLLALEEEMGSVSTGLSPQSLASLQYREVGDLGEVQKCSVCMEDLAKEQVAVRLPLCGHVYHQPCVEQWLTVKNCCPVCRLAVS